MSRDRVIPDRILMVRMSAMGDIVHTLPCAATLRRGFPNAEIDWLVEERWSGLLDGNPHVTQVQTVQRRDWSDLVGVIARLRQRRYDCALDFQGLIKSAAIAKACGVKELVGFETDALREKLAAAAYNRQVNVAANAHVVEKNLALAQSTGVDEAVLDFVLPAGTDSRPFEGKYLTVSPSAGWQAKRWPLENYAELAARVHAEIGWPVAINLGPGEDALAQPIIDKMPAGRAKVVQGDIPTLIGLVRGSAAFVAGDTGPLHIAAAVGTPVVAIFGATDPQRNGPYSPHCSKRTRVVRAADVETTYSRSASDEGVARVSVDDVFRALTGVIS